MKRFLTLLGFEFKKIARGRVAVASLALCAALLFALTLISEMVARPEGSGARTLTGRAVDDGFVAEVADAAARAGGLTAVPPESPYCQAARWMNRMLGNSVSIADVSGDVAPDMLTAGALYGLICLLTGAAVMALSVWLQNAMAVTGIVGAMVTADLFITVPARLRVLSQMRYLTPIQIMINSAMTDPRLILLFGRYVTPLQAAAMLYAAATMALYWLTGIGYKRLRAG